MNLRFCLGSALAALLLLMMTAAGARAQSSSSADGASQGALREAFAAGDARAVLEHAAGRVEVGLPEGGSSQYSRSQAVYVLGQFFENYPPQGFLWERTSTRGRSRSLTGHYRSEAARAPLRVYVRLSKSGGGWQLQEARVEAP